MAAGIQPPPRPQGYFTLPAHLRALALAFPLQGNSSFLSLSHTCLTLTQISALTTKKHFFTHTHLHTHTADEANAACRPFS